jgi:L-2,4-diaminobutyrate decarboxylase
MFKIISCCMIFSVMVFNFSNADQITTESLREKFFLTDSNKKEMQNLGHKVNDVVVDYLSGADNRKIYAGKSYLEIKEQFRQYKIPADSQDLSLVFKRIDSIVDDSMHYNNKYIGHMLTLPSFFSVLVNPIIDAMNFDMSDDNVPDFIRGIEEQTVNWLAEMMGYKIPKTESKNKPVPGGIMTNGGTVANFMAFLVFRNKYLASRGIDFNTEGLLSLPENEKLTVFVSKEAHYSLKKIGEYIGLGSDNVVSVDVDENFSMDIQDLKSKINQAKSDGKIILGIIANAGSTSTGAIDPLEEIATIAKENNTWFHVDAAYGGACAITQRHKKLKKAMSAMKLADSITMDPHKLLYIPYNLGSFLVKDRKNLCYVKGIENFEDVKLSGKTIQNSKRFDAFKLWTALKFMGVDNIAKLIDYTIDMTFYMHKLFENAEDFENLSDPQMNIFVFRYIPSELKKELEKAVTKKNFERVRDVNEQLNKLNVKLQEKLQEEGNAWLSYTIFGKSKYNKCYKDSNTKLIAQRLVLMNPFVSTESLDKSFLTIRKTAERVANIKMPVNKFPKRLSIPFKVKKEVDSFRKYFASEHNKEEVRRIGKNIIDIITGDKPNNEQIDLNLQESVPNMSSSAEHMLSVLQKVYEDSFKLKEDKSLNVPFIAILSSSIFTALNQNQIAFEVAPASTVVEDKLVCELANLVGYRQLFLKESFSDVLIEPGGIVTNGLSFSLLTMLLVARNKLLQQKQKDKQDVTKVSLKIATQNDDLVFITSKTQESVMKELASVLGLGSQRVVVVDEINDNTNIDSLIEQIYLAEKSNKTIMAVDICVSDVKALDMVKLQQLRKLENLFVNITLVGNSKKMLKEKKFFCSEFVNVADSVVLNLQDWFNIQNGVGVVLFKDRDVLETYLKQSAPYVIRQTKDSIMRNIGSYSIEGSKGFQAFPLWVALQNIGV